MLAGPRPGPRRGRRRKRGRAGRRSRAAQASGSRVHSAAPGPPGGRRGHTAYSTGLGRRLGRMTDTTAASPHQRQALTVGVGAGGLATADMVLNIGPQHPATHGVLRLRIVVDGERIVSAEPIVGYMHRGAEKLFEVRDYRQIIVLANRHDWLQRLLQRARRRARRRADARHGGARASRLGAHRARRAQPGAQPPDVPRQLPPRARRHHAGLPRVPRARGAPGRHGGGRRAGACTTCSTASAASRRTSRPGGWAASTTRSPTCAGGCPTRAPHRRQRDPRGADAWGGVCRGPWSRPTASPARSRGPAG